MTCYIDQGYQLHERPDGVPVNWRVGVYGLIERDGKLLMVDQIVAGGPTLSLPGGGVDLDPEETILEGSVREVYEETGYRFTPDPGSLKFLDEAFFRSPSGRYWHIVAFLVQGTVDDVPDPNWQADPDEIVSVKWVDPAALARDDLRTLHWNALVTLGHTLADP